MIVTVIGLSLIALLVLVAVTAVNGDTHLDRARPRAETGLRGGQGRDRRLRLPPPRQQRLLGGMRQRADARAPSTRSARPKTPPGAREAPAPTYAIELMPCDRRQSTCDPSSIADRDGEHARVERPAEGNLPDPLHRLLRQAKRRSSPPSSRPASSTTSTSPSARPRTRSPMGPKIAEMTEAA